LQSQGRRNALISGQVSVKKEERGSGGPPPEKYFRFGAMRGGREGREVGREVSGGKEGRRDSRGKGARLNRQHR